MIVFSSSVSGSILRMISFHCSSLSGLTTYAVKVVSPSAILFATSTGTGSDEFKLTLADRGIEIVVPDNGNVSVKGNTVTIPCEIKGIDAGSSMPASVLVLDKEYTDIRCLNCDGYIDGRSVHLKDEIQPYSAAVFEVR